MIKGIALLAISSLLSLFSGFFCSTLMNLEDYGRIVSYSSIITLAVTFFFGGFSGYYLSNKNQYESNINLLITYFVWISFGFLLTLLIMELSFVSLGFGVLFILSAVASLFVLHGQIYQRTSDIVLSQAIPQLAKAISGLLLCLLMLLGALSKNKALDGYSILLFILCFIAIVYFVIKALTAQLRFNWRLNFRNTIFIVKGSIPYTGSALLALSYGLAIPSLLAFKGDYDLSAYYGVYLIFWSVNSLLISMVINNYLLPQYAQKRAENTRNNVGFQRKGLLLISGIAFISLFSPVVAAYVFATYLWHEYKQIEVFLFFSAVALFVRAFSAWYGMFISLGADVRMKIYSQIMILFVAVTGVVFLDMNPEQLSRFIVFIEGMLFLLYFISSRLSLSRA